MAKYYNFRDKSGGWGLGYRAKTKTKTKTKTKPANLDPYYYHFLKGDTYRECCYHCNYCTKGRVGDITIGDYWGIEKEHPMFYSTKGVSVVLLNTDNGLRWFERVKNMFYVQESSFEQAARKNHNLLYQTKRPDFRDVVYQKMNSQPTNEYFDKVLTVHVGLSTRIKGFLPMKIKLILKTIKQQLWLQI